MSNSIKKIYFFFLQGLSTLQIIRKKSYFIIYFLLAFFLMQNTYSVNAAQKKTAHKKISKKKYKKAKQRKKNAQAQEPKTADNTNQTQESKTAVNSDQTQESKIAANTDQTQESKTADNTNQTQESKTADNSDQTQESKTTANSDQTQESKTASNVEQDQKIKTTVNTEKAKEAKATKQVKKAKKTKKVKKAKKTKQLKKSKTTKKKSKVEAELKSQKKLKKQKKKSNTPSVDLSTSVKKTSYSSYEYIDDIINNQYTRGLKQPKTQTEWQMARLITVLHTAFETLWRVKLEESLNKSIPMLIDKNTQLSLKLFIGENGNEGENMIKKIAAVLKQQGNPMIRYMIFTELIGASWNKKKVKYKIKQLITLKENAEVTYALCDLHQEYFAQFYYTTTYLASHKIPLPFQDYLDLFQGQSIKQLTKSELLLKLEKNLLGGYASKAANKNVLTSFFFRLLLIEVGWTEVVREIERLFTHGKRWFRIIMQPKTSWMYQFKYKPEDLANHNYLRHPTPIGKITMFSLLSGFFKYIPIPGGEHITFYVCSLFHIIPNFIQEFLPGPVPLFIDIVWNTCRNVYYNCLRLREITNGLINLLHSMRENVILIKKTKKLLESNPQLLRDFSAEYKQIRLFTNLKKTKKFRKILAKMKNIRKTPVGLGFILQPWKLLPTRLMALYSKIVAESEEVTELLRAAQFATLKVLYAAIKAKSVLLSPAGQTPYPTCIPTISDIEHDEAEEEVTTNNKPEMVFEDMYTPMLHGVKKKIVKNSIQLGGSLFKNIIVMGPNASGKSVLLKTVAVNTLVSVAMGIGFAKSINILQPPHIIVFDANASDNMSTGTSLFQEEAGRYETLISIIKKYNLPILVIFDEKLGSTIPKEAIFLLTSMLITLEQEKGITLLLSSHFREMINLFKKMKLEQFRFMSTEYKKGEGFTFKVKDGISKHPSSVYTLMDMNFHDKTFNKFIAMLHDDPTYPFKDKLPGYKEIKRKKSMSKTLRFLLYIMLILSLLGLAFFFFRRFKITVSLETKKGPHKNPIKELKELIKRKIKEWFY